MIALKVNGEARRLAAAQLSDALEELIGPVPARGLAVALNGAIVPRQLWSETVLGEGDRLEIVRAVAGG